MFPVFYACQCSLFESFFTVFDACHECLKGRRTNERMKCKPRKWGHQALAHALLQELFCNIYMLARHRFRDNRDKIFTMEMTYSGNYLKTLLMGDVGFILRNLILHKLWSLKCLLWFYLSDCETVCFPDFVSSGWK